MTEESKVIWIYIGRRMGKARVLYCWVDEGWTENDTEHLHVYYKQIVRYAPVGARYTMTVANEDGSVWTSGDKAPVYEGMVEDKDLIGTWQLADRTSAQQEANLKQQKRAKDQDMIREALLPIRQLLHGRKAGVDKSALFGVLTAEFWRPLSQAEERELKW